jgi:hypothetical protein
MKVVCVENNTDISVGQAAFGYVALHIFSVSASWFAGCTAILPQHDQTRACQPADDYEIFTAFRVL